MTSVREHTTRRTGAVLIEVSQADIDQAMHGNSRFCPIAIALHRQGYEDPTVTKNGVRLRNGAYLELPKEARTRIDAWDGDSRFPPVKIAPFSFWLGAAS